MTTKRIIFSEANMARFEDVEITTPKAGEVQVAIEFSAISSGTERANLSGEIHISYADYATEAVFPRFGGYSTAGTVLAVGEGVTTCKVGDRVAMAWTRHQKVQNVPAENVFCLPEGISFQEAALFNIATFPLAAIRKCRVEMGEPVVVMGMGILGLFSLPLLRLAGAAPIIAVDPVLEKREKALASGADYALDPYDPAFADTVKKLTGGGARVAIEVTGVGKALDGVLDCMAPMGRVALLGCTRHSDFTIDYYHKVHGPGVQLIGAHTIARPKKESSNGLWTLRDDMTALMRLIKAGRLSLATLVDEVHTPEETVAVYQRLVSEPTFPVVQFDWRQVE